MLRTILSMGAVGRHTRAAVLAALLAALAAAAADGTPVAQAQIGPWTEPPVRPSLVAQRTVVRPGDQLALAVILDYDPGFHSWTNSPVVPPEFAGLIPIPTTIEPVDLPATVRAWPVQWPPAHPVSVNYTGTPVIIEAFEGRAVAYLPIEVDAATPLGGIDLAVKVGWQACDETTCYFPEEVTLAATLEVAPAGTTGGLPPDPALFAGFHDSAFQGGAAAACAPVALNAFEWRFSLNPCGAGGFGLLLLTALIGGFFLNFTPCVLPVIPLKIMGLSRAAGRPTRLVFLGAMMSAGVIAFWLVLGGAIAFVSGVTAISSLFQTGWFSLVVGAFVAIMALGMFDVFTVTLPQVVHRVTPRQETAGGSFGFGIMTAVLSTPCTAPLMGGASAWAATQSAPVTLATFGAIGAGMALPYLGLALRPGLLHKVPRSGPASELVKQVMGLAMLAVAAFFLGIPIAAGLATPPDPASRAYWWVVAAFVVAAAGWMVVSTWRISSRPGRRLVVTAVGAVVMAGALATATSLASDGPVDWVYYTPERLAEAGARNDVVVLDFTAEWCLNCKVLEAGVLYRPEVVALLESPGVTPMRIDLTGDNPEGRKLMEQLRWVGLPLLAVLGPATGYVDTPHKYDSYTQDMVRDALVAAAATAGR